MYRLAEKLECSVTYLVAGEGAASSNDSLVRRASALEAVVFGLDRDAEIDAGMVRAAIEEVSEKGN